MAHWPRPAKDFWLFLVERVPSPLVRRRSTLIKPARGIGFRLKRTIMPQLFIEFFSEEIPARMQARAADDLLRLLEGQLSAAGLKGESARAFAGPRRLAVVMEGLPERTPDLKEERKGPRVGAPEQALAGFLKAAGLSSIEEATVQEDPKGAFYVAKIDKPGRMTADIVAEALPAVAKSFPWPKSMRSGEQDFYWVRPLQGVVAIFNNEIVPCEIGGITAGRLTRGHRFHAPSSFDVSDFEDYAAKLRAQWVVLDAAERKALILERANKLCKDAGLEMVEDAGLLDEVAGLVEWPVPVLGKMDPAFLDLPAEVIRLSMRTHQKYFAVRDPATGKLAPNFITVANIDAVDGGKAIAAGNARVLSARLNDARYFWDLDRFYDPIERTKQKKLDAPERIEKLKQIVFHQKLGSVWDKVERVRALAKELCAVTGADPELVDRAAVLSKCDLVTEVVGEFPELQGQIGRQLAELQGDNASVAIAVEDHYRPLGPNDRVPTDPVAVTLALADKIDSIFWMYSVGEKASGSGDKFALRRAALGVNSITQAKGLRFEIESVLELAFEVGRRLQPTLLANSEYGDADPHVHCDVVVSELQDFFIDRLKVQLRDQGKRHDLVVSALMGHSEGDHDLVRIVARVEALEAFLKTDDGANLLAGYKRAVNILRAEEKKEAGLAESLAADLVNNVEPSGVLDAERNLSEVLVGAELAAQHALNSEDFAGAMGALARLRAPVDAFFDQVLVNDPDPMLRRSRLLLLSKVRAALERVADFSQIEG
jgi:glycyl-tRNA synthetase beta chain